MKNICAVVGARPQFIKLAPLAHRLTRKSTFFILHTGQHYDKTMSASFFHDLEIPPPDVNLGVGSASHAEQTGKMMMGIEKVLFDLKPDLVLVFGDTNSTLAGSLAAVKLRIKIAHIEAGLRSFNRNMAEEINRILTDQVSDFLFCPSQTAVENLKNEGITRNVYLVGDVMHDALMFAKDKIKDNFSILKKFKIEKKKYLLATLHRAENTDNESRLKNILAAFSQIKEKIVFLVHPRTQKMINQFGLHTQLTPNIIFHEPLGFLDMTVLEKNARMIVTDSGGMQKEAYWLQVPCITLRDETEWMETVAAGWNVLVGAEPERIIVAINGFSPAKTYAPLYRAGNSIGQIAEIITENFSDVP